MPFTIEVFPLAEKSDSTLSGLHLVHSGCGPTTLGIHRNPATDEWSLRCPCGLVVVFSRPHHAEPLKWTAIDGRLREIGEEAYSSNIDGPFLCQSSEAD